VPVAAPLTNAGAAFAARRAAMVSLINTHADAVLCVSDRVRQIAAHHGLSPEKLHTSYIGTTEATKWQTTQPKPRILRPDSTLRLAYLGYMRRDKGFFFLLDALEALPDTLAASLRLTVAARRGEAAVVARLQALAPRLAELRLIDGYTHAGLDELLADVDLGLVPVMWEDNLPQVAIEMHARHIPLLTSDRGGAQELGRCPALTFRAGDTTDFARVLETVLSERITQASYWQNAMPPVTMEAHLSQLLSIYEETP
jgi:glycosyltransferase involved in cell wall biosynthesis